MQKTLCQYLVRLTISALHIYLGYLCSAFCMDFSHFRGKQTRLTCTTWHAVSSKQRTSTHLFSSSSCQQECHVPTTPAPTVLTRFSIFNFHLFPKVKEYLRRHKFCDDVDVECTANGWLEQQEELFWYNRIFALKKCWT